MTEAEKRERANARKRAAYHRLSPEKKAERNARCRARQRAKRAAERAAQPPAPIPASAPAPKRVSPWRDMDAQPDLQSKNQLRAMFAEAAQNTARMQRRY
jgi:hypothetical protein